MSAQSVTGCPHYRDWLDAQDCTSLNQQNAVYDPSTEELPADEWHPLQHDNINRAIDHMCSGLVPLVQQYAPADAEI